MLFSQKSQKYGIDTLDAYLKAAITFIKPIQIETIMPRYGGANQGITIGRDTTWMRIYGDSTLFYAGGTLRTRFDSSGWKTYASKTDDAQSLVNLTAATPTVQQHSPFLRLSANAWDPTSGTSKTITWRIQNQAFASAGPGGGVLVAKVSKSGSDDIIPFAIDEQGRAYFGTFTGQNFSGYNVILAGNTTVGWISNGVTGNLDVNGQVRIGNNSESPFTGYLILYDDAAHAGTLYTTTLSGNQVYTLPDSSGTIALIANTKAETKAQIIDSLNAAIPSGIMLTQAIYTTGSITSTSEQGVVIGSTTQDGTLTLWSPTYDYLGVLSPATLTGGRAWTMPNASGTVAVNVGSMAYADSTKYHGSESITTLSPSIAIYTSGSITSTSEQGIVIGSTTQDGTLTLWSPTYDYLGVLSPATLTGGRAWTMPNASGTVITTGNLLNITATSPLADSCLATISTAGKVSGSAITTDNIYTSGSITSTSEQGVVIGSTTQDGSLTLWSAANDKLAVISSATLSNSRAYSLPNLSGTFALTTNSTFGSGSIWNGAAIDTQYTDAKVRKIIAGSNVTISPTSGLGDVTINSLGGVDSVYRLIYSSASDTTAAGTVGTKVFFENLPGWYTKVRAYYTRQASDSALVAKFLMTVKKNSVGGSACLYFGDAPSVTINHTTVDTLITLRTVVGTAIADSVYTIEFQLKAEDQTDSVLVKHLNIYAVKYTTGGGGGGGGKSYITQPADKPPDNSNSFDDEFNISTIDTTSKWKWRNRGVTTYLAAQQSFCVMRDTGTGATSNWRILEQTITDTTWSITAKISYASAAGAFNNVGLIAFDLTNGRLLDFGPAQDASYCYVQLNKYNSVTSYNSSGYSKTVNANAGLTAYYRLRKDSAKNFYADLSQDGVVWSCVWSEAGSTFIESSGKVDRIGIGVNAYGSGIIAPGVFWFFRYNWTADFDPTTDN